MILEDSVPEKGETWNWIFIKLKQLFIRHQTVIHIFDEKQLIGNGRLNFPKVKKQPYLSSRR